MLSHAALARALPILALVGGCTATAAAPGFFDDEPNATVDAGPDAQPSSPDDASTEIPCPRVGVRVARDGVLNVRPTASTEGAPVGSLPPYAIVDVLERVEGEAIDGVSLWYRIATPTVSGFVFSGLATCTEATPETFSLPYCDASPNVSQGNQSNFSHQGRSAYAFDFTLASGVPLLAMSDGEVVRVYDQTVPGSRCYNGGDSSCVDEINLVTLAHADGSMTSYFHLSTVSVKLGDKVPRGGRVGLVGSTGWSTGPHAHVERQEACDAFKCLTIPMEFADVGVPVEGQTVPSPPCPTP